MVLTLLEILGEKTFYTVEGFFMKLCTINAD